jgi:opacity protein-like surface antigen
MIKALLLCFVILFLNSTSFAFDDSVRPYIGIFAGCPVTHNTKLTDTSGTVDTVFDPGILGGLVVGASTDTDWGYNINRLRIEAEASYRTNELKKISDGLGNSTTVKGTFSVTNFMLNGYLENSNFMTKEMPVSLFLTAGVGAAMGTITEISYSGSTLVASGKNTQLAYQGGAGIGSELTRNILIDLTYRYMGTTPFKFSAVSADYGSHNVQIGARYLFD